MPGGAAGLQNQSGGRKVPGGFDSLPSPPTMLLPPIVRALTAVAAGQLFKSLKICVAARRDEKLIATCNTGWAARELNLLITDNRHRKQIRKLLEYIRDQSVGQWRMLADLNCQQAALASVNGYRGTVTQQGSQVRKGDIA